MKKIRKIQLITVIINLVIIAMLFITVFVYDNYLREPLVTYKRPIIPMEKVTPREELYFESFDKMDLFSQYKGTRAVGSTRPAKLIIIIAHPSFEQYFHFSRLFYEASLREYGLVLMDFSDIRNYIPIEKENGEIFSGNERKQQFLLTMIAYMKQYGFKEFKIAYMGMAPSGEIPDELNSLPVTVVPDPPQVPRDVYSQTEELLLIDRVFDFKDL